jgi:hypothetical protein
MVKKPKRIFYKIDPNITLQTKKDKEELKKDPIIILSYKMTPCDKVSLAIGYFIIFMIIGGSIFYSLMQSQRITSDENSSWAGTYILLLFFDFLLFEFLAIIISTFFLKKVGSNPEALGPFRNVYLKYGPRLIKTATVGPPDKPKEGEPSSPKKKVIIPGQRRQSMMFQKRVSIKKAPTPKAA